MMDFWVGVNLPYQRMEMGTTPWSTAPLWYLSGVGWTNVASFLEPMHTWAKLMASTSARRVVEAIWERGRSRSTEERRGV